MITWCEDELAAARPPEKITISQHACKYRELGKLSAISGLYSLEITPFFGPVMDRCGNAAVDEQYLCAPAQIGKTVAVLENVAIYYLHQDPSSIMICLADEDTAKFVANEKIAPAFRESHALAGLYEKNRFNNKTIDTPNGGHIDFAWASSEAKTASRPERIVIADEVDKPGYYTTSKEASALSRLKDRTKSYPAGYYKHIFLSTPTTEEGNIVVLLGSADVIIDWHVPCPFCGMLQPLRWSKKYCHGFTDNKYLGSDGQVHELGQVVWSGGRDATADQIRETARYECGTCREKWTSLEKNAAVRRGIEVSRDGWVVDNENLPQGKRRYGNHINRVYSTVDSGKLENLVTEWVQAFRLKGIEQIGAIQGFVNSALAEPFKQTVELETGSSDAILRASCDLGPQIVPSSAAALVAFVDVQKLGFWFTVRAFAKNSTSWLIHYGFLPTWDDVENLLFKTAYPIDGERVATMKVWRAGIDTGGGKKYQNMSMTEETYFWIRSHMGKGCFLWGTKGSSTPLPGKIRINKPLDTTPSGKALIGGLQVIQLNTDMLKDTFHYRLGQAAKQGDQAAYLHKDTDATYVRHILAEEKRKDNRGHVSWVQTADRNDLLDCEAGCIALASPEWPGGGVNLIANRVGCEADIQATGRTGRPDAEAKPKPGRGGYVRPAWMGA